MRVALKIAYEGRDFYGHQRQPHARTVEGECLAALRAARVLRDPHAAFFRSASRTDRGVSAIGNVIAFQTNLAHTAVLGAFNGKAHGVWAWAVAAVPDAFHPRHATERWYRYHLLDPLPLQPLRAAAAVFVGEHDFRWFTSDPPLGPMSIARIDVVREEAVTLIDIRARSFRRGLVRRIVAGMSAHARDEVGLGEIEATLRGERHDFGTVRPEPLFLMDVRYEGVAFEVMLKPKVRSDWEATRTDLWLRNRFLQSVVDASRDSGSSATPIDPGRS